jgi:hypothetical protein
MLKHPLVLTVIKELSAMTIYLYVKTHNRTKLKYLGKTESKNPHHYPGSGTYWKLHLDKHGHDYTTKILRECHDKEELKKWGLYYTNLWNIVESNEWANLKQEIGDGGRQCEEVRKRISEAGKGRIPWNKGKKIWNDVDKKRIGDLNRARGPQSKKTIAKRVAKNTGKIRTELQKKKMSESQKGRILTEEHKFKLSIARQNGLKAGTIIPWNKGIRLSN